MATQRLSFDTLAKQPRHFRAFTGFTVKEFAELAATIRSDWESSRKAGRIPTEDRVRKEGGGRKLDLPALEDRLLVFVIWAKVYPTYLFLEYLIGVDESNICRIIQEFLPILSATIIIDKSRKKIRSLEELKELIPDLGEVLVDATEQRVPRPQKKRVRKKHHSGKKKGFTMKTQIMATKEKIILHASDSSPGRIHDYRLFKKTDVPQWLERHPDVTARLDLGYLGIHKDYPDIAAVLPFKRFRGMKELSRSQKIHNTKRAKKRIPVENALANLKKFRVLADVFRNVKERYSATFKSICFLSNFRTLARS
jgi:hypothetical protein